MTLRNVLEKLKGVIVLEKTDIDYHKAVLEVLEKHKKDMIMPDTFKLYSEVFNLLFTHEEAKKISGKKSASIILKIFQAINDEKINIPEDLKIFSHHNITYVTQRINRVLLDILDNVPDKFSPKNMEILQKCLDLFRFLKHLKENGDLIGKGGSKAIADFVKQAKIKEGGGSDLLLMFGRDDAKDLMYLRSRLMSGKIADIDSIERSISSLIGKQKVSDDDIRRCLKFFREVGAPCPIDISKYMP